MRDGNLLGPSCAIKKRRPLSYFALDSRFEKARTAAGVKSEEFQFRDLRAKAASEKADRSGMLEAQR
jgi:hypothetical protein